MDRDVDRRAFIKLVSGVGVAMASSCASAHRPPAVATASRDDQAPVPKRRFGRTDIGVSALCLGGSSVVGTDSTSLLDQALGRGVDCWEHTMFTGRAFGDYFKAHPGSRERVFLTAKSRGAAPAVMQADLERALADNQTNVIDFFAVHGVDRIEVLSDEVRRWAEKAKQARRIRCFGFCSHKRVDSCLERAAELEWIDGVQVFYNYRTQAIGSTEAALRKCHARGIGIFTVKSMGLCVQDEDALEDAPFARERLRTRLADHGLRFEQAKLRAVWQSPHVTSICSLMPTPAMLHANASAATEQAPLSAEVAGLLAEYAEATGRHFCRRCGACDDSAQDGIPIFTVMESLMYARSYRARDLAAKLFAQVPPDVRQKMAGADYAKAEGLCPQRMPIARLMNDALAELGR